MRSSIRLADETRSRTHALTPTVVAKGHVREWVAELAGTALLLFPGFCVVAMLMSPLSPGPEAIPSRSLRFLLVGVAFGLLVAGIASSPIGRRSGAHLNPAVSLAFWLRGRMHPGDLAGFVGAQILGALLGTWLFLLVMGDWARSIDLARTSPAPVGDLGGIAIEAALTFGLLAVIFVATASPRLLRLIPGLVAFALVALIWAGSPPTGASLNPARSLAPAFLDGELASIWVYIAGPALGALAAAAAHPLLTARRPMLTRRLCPQGQPNASASALKSAATRSQGPSATRSER